MTKRWTRDLQKHNGDFVRKNGRLQMPDVIAAAAIMSWIVVFR